MRELIGFKRGLLAAAAVAVVGLGAQDVAAEGAGQEIRVSRAVTCLDVQEREPVNIDSVFSNQVGQVFCYTHIEGASEDTRIEHVWLHEGEERGRVSLPVRSPNWRTWSSKRLLPSWTGQWKIEVRRADGSVLKTLEFAITEVETGSPPPGLNR
ncbi:MAG: DUF2914 domain-containing protein [Acidobacteriota bacterium]|nr:DUF2914 domain-containing protein [Acidobacteriota bacterium]